MGPGKRPLNSCTKARPAKRPRPNGTVDLFLAADEAEPFAASAVAFAATATEAAEAATEAQAAASAAMKRAPELLDQIAATNTASDHELLDQIALSWHALAVVQGNVRQVCLILRISDLTKESVGTRGSHMGHVMQGYPWIP